jgi:hypothetical protein
MPFKQIEIKPLTNLDSETLNVIATKRIEIDNPSDEKVNQALSNLYSYIANNPEIITTTNIGEEAFITSFPKNAKNKRKVFPFPEPNPICIYYQSANEYLEKAYSIKNKIYSDNVQFDYIHNYKNFVDYYKFVSQGIIFLITTIEGFINQILPDELVLEGNPMSKKILEFKDLNYKVTTVLPQICDVDFKQTNSSEWSMIETAIQLRHDLIHLKTEAKSNRTNYQKLFKRLVDFDHLGCSNATYKFINTIVKDYFVELPSEA